MWGNHMGFSHSSIMFCLLGKDHVPQTTVDPSAHWLGIISVLNTYSISAVSCLGCHLVCVTQGRSIHEASWCRLHHHQQIARRPKRVENGVGRMPFTLSLPLQPHSKPPPMQAAMKCKCPTNSFLKQGRDHSPPNSDSCMLLSDLEALPGWRQCERSSLKRIFKGLCSTEVADPRWHPAVPPPSLTHSNVKTSYKKNLICSSSVRSWGILLSIWLKSKGNTECHIIFLNIWKWFITTHSSSLQSWPVKWFDEVTILKTQQNHNSSSPA